MLPAYAPREFSGALIAITGNRISDICLKGNTLDAGRTYKLASWAPVAAGAPGETAWDVVARYLRDRKVIKPPVLNRPRVTGVAGNPGLTS